MNTVVSSAFTGTASDSMRHVRGNTMLEFTLVGIPLVFVLISTIEMARGMCAYNSLGHSVREATRFASRSGENCSDGVNDCTTSVSEMAARVQASAFGIPANDLSLSLTSTGGTTSCSPASSCLEDQSLWPPIGANMVGSEITITATYVFRPAMAMLWPGARTVEAFGTFLLRASSTERIQF